MKIRNFFQGICTIFHTIHIRLIFLLFFTFELFEPFVFAIVSRPLECMYYSAILQQHNSL
jgi:hypothetical protein